MGRLGIVGLLLVACSGGDTKEDGGGDDGSSTSTTLEDSGGGSSSSSPCGSDLVLTDDNNYGFVSDLSISTVQVMAESDFVIDWSAVTTDIRGRPVDPTAVQQLLLVELASDQAGVLDMIDANDLRASSVLNQYLYFNGGVDVISVSDMEILANPMDLSLLTDDPSTTWLLSLANIVDARFDFLMNVFIEPDDTSTNTTVAFDDTTATLTFDADLQTADPLCAGPGLDAYTLDWSGATTDVFGRDLDLGLVTRLIVGRVATDEVSDLEQDFLQLYEIADELYTLDVNGLTFGDLTQATDASGVAFDGFTSDGTWVVGIECTRSECTNPAPLLLSVVEVR